jgi:hypothetical protein
MSSMSIRSKVARPLVGVAALLFALALPGCGGHRHHHDDDFGTLEIVNDDSFDMIETVELEDLFDPYHEFFDVDLLPGDSVEIDLFPSTYEVTIYWDNVEITSSIEDIFEDTTLTLFVSNDP